MSEGNGLAGRPLPHLRFWPVGVIHCSRCVIEWARGPFSGEGGRRRGGMKEEGRERPPLARPVQTQCTALRPKLLKYLIPRECSRSWPSWTPVRGLMEKGRRGMGLEPEGGGLRGKEGHRAGQVGHGGSCRLGYGLLGCDAGLLGPSGMTVGLGLTRL